MLSKTSNIKSWRIHVFIITKVIYCVNNQRQKKAHYISDMEYKNFDTYADRLKWARKQRGLSQAELARLAGVKQSTIAQQETGARVVKGNAPRSLVAIASALDVNPEWLSNNIGSPFGVEQERAAYRVIDRIEKEASYWPFSVSKREIEKLPQNKIDEIDRYITAVITIHNGNKRIDK